MVCPNVLGGCQGTTGPSTDDPEGVPWGSRFPQITIRDQVAVEAALADELGIDRWAAVIGGSMGGMRSLEWAIGYPERVSRSVVLAVGRSSCASLTRGALALWPRSRPLSPFRGTQRKPA